MSIAATTILVFFPVCTNIITPGFFKQLFNLCNTLLLLWTCQLFIHFAVVFFLHVIDRLLAWLVAVQTNNAFFLRIINSDSENVKRVCKSNITVCVRCTQFTVWLTCYVHYLPYKAWFRNGYENRCYMLRYIHVSSYSII